MSRLPWTARAALALLILLIGLSALAFGSREVWAAQWLRFGVLAVLVLAAWSAPWRSLLGGAGGRLALPAALVVVWGLFQAMPLPEGLLSLLSPRAAEIYEATVPAGDHGALADALLESARGEGLQIEGQMPGGFDAPVAVGSAGRSLSLYPRATLDASAAWLTPLLVLVATAYLSRSHRARYHLFWGIGLWSGLIGLLAILQRLTWNNELLWFRPRPVGSRPLGPFVNPNHLAGYVEMGTLIAIGLTLALLARPTRRLDLDGIRTALMDREWSLPRILAASTVALAGLSGLLLSRSIGGLLAFGTGLLFLLLARRLRAALPVAAILIVVVGVAVGLVSMVGPQGETLEAVPFAISQEDPSTALRVDAWSRTFRIWQDFPVSGSGLGTFSWSFAFHQSRGEWMLWYQAHNDYLQFLAETGAVGAALMLWALWVLVRRIFWPVFRHGDETPWTTVACGAAVLAMLVHSIVDFNLQVPSNAVLFAAILGALAAAARDAEPGGGSS